MPSPGRVLLIGVCLLIGSVRARGEERGAAPLDEAEWREAMSRVHARFGYVPIYVGQVSEQPARPVRMPTPRKAARHN